MYDNINDLLSSIQKDLEETLNGYASFDDLFNNGFLEKNSDFSTIDALFEANGIKIYSQNEFEDLDKGMVDMAIAHSSKFSTWEEMYEYASNEYIIHKLKANGFEIT
jgi:hypothetical protein